MAPCVRGCYRCLLSYYNQPDHLLIDRKDPDALARLVRMAGSRTTPTASGESAAAVPVTDHGPPGDTWSAAFAAAGVPAPSGPGSVGGIDLPWRWPGHRIAAVPGALPPGAADAADDQGWTLVALADAPPLPQSFIDLFKAQGT
jgi:hypothetical protein